MEQELNNELEQELHDDQLVVRYLLNELPDPEKMEFEEQYFGDYGFFERMRAVEEELIEDYVRGNLSAPQRAHFRQHYLSTPERRGRVESARALIRAVSPEPAAAVSAPASVRSERISWWHAVLASLPRPIPATGFALAAMLLVSIGLWSLVATRRLRHQLEQTQAEQAALERREQELERQVVNERGRNTQLAEELEQARRQREQIRIPPAPRAQPVQPPRSPSIIASLTFLPGTGDVRESVGPKKKLIIPTGEGWVQLRLHLESNEFKSYRVALRPVSGGDAVWDQQGLKAQTINGKAVVLLKVPANSFTANGVKDYFLTVSGRRAAGEYEEVKQYYFQAVKQ